jgi:N-methylhydantoinase A/oxoprolinase/acetone carboxylase beta subunit
MAAIGIDIGGTFTDIVCATPEGIYAAKASSTPDDLVRGVTAAIRKVLEQSQLAAGSVRRLVHGSTVATNAILEGKGARIGLLMTKGFEDTLELGRFRRSNMYDLMNDAETPFFMAPARVRVGIAERIDAEGCVLEPLDEVQVVDAVGQLRAEYGIEALAVCYLFSFRNPAHELRTRELVAEHFPDLRLSLSCEVDPVFREYERCCVTAFDAYVRPIVARYLERFEKGAQACGIAAPLEVMQSRGAIAGRDAALQKAVSMVLSGPAAGVVGGSYAAKQSGFADAIVLDMGGTSCDVSLVRAGKPLLSTRGKVGPYPLRIPLVDVNTIGAGGGSIAWVDAGGGLRVGPQSAGASPGPAAYGRGGEEPTVTDASLLLGYLNPDYFAGGELQLAPPRAEAAVARLAAALHLSVIDTAAGIHRVVNARMADQIRLVSIRQGYDPRQFILVLMGGAGPVHGGALARDLGIRRCVVPPAPGVLSAFGLLVAPVECERSQTVGKAVEALPVAEVESVFATLEERGWADVARSGAARDQVVVLRSADLRYRGQSYELEVPVDGADASTLLDSLVDAFHARHMEVYGHMNKDAVVEVVNLRTVHRVPVAPPGFAFQGRRPLASGRRCRSAYFEGQWMETQVLDRTELQPGVPLTGPAIIEQPDTTTVVYPHQIATLDPVGNVMLESRA